MREVEISKSEEYMLSLLDSESESKKKSRLFSEELNLARISVNPAEAQLIKTLICSHRCEKFVEIGTLTGLSAQYIFEGLAPEGTLWTLEKDPRHMQYAQQAFAGVDHGNKKIEFVLGDAREELKKLEALGPFDGIFIDGNKAAYMDYLEWAEKNIKTGGLILADNVFLNGSVWGEASARFSEKQIRIMQEFNKRLADPEKFVSVIAPTFEGLYIAIKK